MCADNIRNARIRWSKQPLINSILFAVVRVIAAISIDSLGPLRLTELIFLKIVNLISNSKDFQVFQCSQ